MISEKMRGYVENSSAIRAMFEEGKKMADQFGAENVYCLLYTSDAADE